jgi:hypothetical protein
VLVYDHPRSGLLFVVVAGLIVVFEKTVVVEAVLVLDLWSAPRCGKWTLGAQIVVGRRRLMTICPDVAFVCRLNMCGMKMVTHYGPKTKALCSRERCCKDRGRECQS